MIVHDASTLAWLGGTSLVVAIGSSLAAARVLLASEDKPTISTRTVVIALVPCLKPSGNVMVAAFGLKPTRAIFCRITFTTVSCVTAGS